MKLAPKFQVTANECANFYNLAVVKYCSRNSYALPSEFIALCSLLEREGIRPSDYFDWYFGIKNSTGRIVKPSRFTDGVLIAEFHQQQY